MNVDFHGLEETSVSNDTTYNDYGVNAEVRDRSERYASIELEGLDGGRGIGKPGSRGSSCLSE